MRLKWLVAVVEFVVKRSGVGCGDFKKVFVVIMVSIVMLW